MRERFYKRQPSETRAQPDQHPAAEIGIEMSEIDGLEPQPVVSSRMLTASSTAEILSSKLTVSNGMEPRAPMTRCDNCAPVSRQSSQLDLFGSFRRHCVLTSARTMKV